MYFDPSQYSSAFDIPGAVNIPIFISIILSVAIISSCIGIVLYLFQAFGLYNMSKTLGVKRPWLAFIPIANYYNIGAISECAPSGGKPIRYSIVLLVLSIAPSLLSGIASGFLTSVFTNAALFNESISPAILFSSILLPFAIILPLAIVLQVFFYMAFYRIFKLFSPDLCVLWLLLAIFVNGSLPIILFCLRKKQPVYPQVQPEMQQY